MFLAAVLWMGPAMAASTSASQLAVHPESELRLGTIGYRLAAANGNRCARPEMMSGLILHDIASYDAGSRPQIMQVYGLGKGFGVLDLIPASSAERAGMRRGDEIVALNGSDLEEFARGLIGPNASPDRADRFLDELESALGTGPAKLTVKRGDGQLEVSLKGEKGCGGRFVAIPGEQLNAWTDGHTVAVTARMMRFAADDQELAFVVAHEMAHNILGHADPRSGGARGKAAEEEADGLAIELLARAGYDLTAPERFLRRSARLQWLALHLSHPGNSQRIRIVASAITRLQRASWAAPALATVTTCAADSLPGGAVCQAGIDGEAVTRSIQPNAPVDEDAAGNALARTAWQPYAVKNGRIRG